MAIRILHVIAGDDFSGAQTIFLDSVSALADADGLVQAVVTRPYAYRLQKLKEKNIPVYTARFSNWLRWRTKNKMQKAIEEFRPDIIQYWMGRAGSYAVPGNHVNVAWYGGYYNPEKRFSNCAHHIVLTKDIQRHVLESDIEHDDVSIIHTLASFPKDTVPVSRKEMDTPQDAVVLLSLSCLHWKKGLDVLINALAELPECVLWVAGHGPMRNELEALAISTRVYERVSFLGERHDRDALLAACDMVVMPSRYEPFGLPMVDAWAMKKPVIAADAKGPADYIQDGHDGVLVPKDNVPALVKAVRKLLAKPEMKDKIVAGGWHKYQSTFTKEAFIRDSMKLYKKLVQK